MSQLLYCQNGRVVAWHDSSQNVPASVYGTEVSIVPWAQSVSSLPRVGNPPAPGQADTRPYAAPTITAQADLANYAQGKQGLILNGGITVNVGTTQSPINVEVGTDAHSLVLLQGAYTMAQANSNATFNWVASTGVTITLTATQIDTIWNVVTNFTQSTFTTLGQVLNGILGNTITSQAQVDSPPSPIPAWPVNS